MQDRDRPSSPDGQKAPAPAGSPEHLRTRLDALKAELGEAIAETSDDKGATGNQRSDGGAVGAGLKAASELVAGVIVGVAIGYFLDRQFGTSPFLLLIFMMFGIAAGFLNLYRLGKTSGR